MKLFALVDCNNFYASCERVFNPQLQYRPIVILSNNDGCVIARSNEAKALGIPMGEPFFKVKRLAVKHSIAVLSSNYVLYGDMSGRVMHCLQHYCPQIEVYSIDESFVELDGMENPTAFALELRNKVKQWTGIPVSIGIGSSKTLAKVANKIAKKRQDGVFVLTEQSLVNNVLQQLEVGDIWGIGGRTTRKLQNIGVTNALQLKNLLDVWVQKHLTIVGLRTVWELQGIACLPLETHITAKKEICTSRTFSKGVNSYEQLSEAIASHTTNAAIKLRKQKAAANGIVVFICTDRFRKEQPQYTNSAYIGFNHPTFDTTTLIEGAKKALASIFRKGYTYRKSGVLLTHLVPQSQLQCSLFDDTPQTTEKAQRLMQCIDTINGKYGKQTVQLLACGIQQDWQMKRQYVSPSFTTRWGELLEVKV